MYASKRERGREEREEMRDRGREEEKMEALKWRDRHRKMQRGTEGERKRMSLREGARERGREE